MQSGKKVIGGVCRHNYIKKFHPNVYKLSIINIILIEDNIAYVINGIGDQNMCNYSN